MKIGMRIWDLFVLLVVIGIVILLVSGFFIYLFPWLFLLGIVLFIIQIIKILLFTRKTTKTDQNETIKQNRPTQQNTTDLIDVEYTIVEDDNEEKK